MSVKKPFVFFGSGPVALESLLLLKQSFKVEAIITKHTTRQEMTAACPDTPVYSVSNNQDLEKFITKQPFESSLGVLIDFGVIVSRNVINSFSKGIINSHFSLLPELRGADPISFAILEGKVETGVSLMLLVQEMDQGPVLAQAHYKLAGQETTPELTRQLVQISYDLLKNNLESYITGNLQPITQEEWQKKNHKNISYTRKLAKQDGIVDWHKHADQLQREVRAYAHWPKSRTQFGNVSVTIIKTSVLNKDGPPGDLFVYNKSLAVYCGQQALIIDKLLPAGKKQMTSEAFLAGYRNRLPL